MDLDQKTRRDYARLRAMHWSAREALRAAKIRTRFEALEYEGRVRLDIEADDMPYQYGDYENEKETNLKIEREGLWGVVTFVSCPCCGAWTHVDSCWGFIGEDWRDSGYDTDLMDSAIDAAEKQSEQKRAG